MPVNALLLSDMRTCIHFALGIFSRNFAPKNDNDDDNYIT